MIIGITGPNASGKGEVAKYLQSKGFTYHSLSDLIREKATELGLPSTRDNLIHIGNQMRIDDGPGVLAKNILLRLGDKDIVDSIRNPAEIEELRNRKDFVLLGIDAPVEIRFKRAQERNRIGDGKTFAQFIADEERENVDNETNQQLNKCLAMVDIKVINDGTLDNLYSKINEVLQKNG